MAIAQSNRAGRSNGETITPTGLSQRFSTVRGPLAIGGTTPELSKATFSHEPPYELTSALVFTPGVGKTFTNIKN